MTKTTRKVHESFE